MQESNSFVPAAPEHAGHDHKLQFIDQELTADQIQKMAAQERVHIIEVVKYDKHGKKISRNLSKNSRVNAGAASVAALLGSAAGVPFNYIALSTTSLTPAMADTSLTGESVVSGLARKIATYGGYVAPTSLNGTATYTMSASFTNNGGSTVTILSCGIFNAASAGTMLAEANLAASEVLNTGESLSFVWTFTL